MNEVHYYFKKQTKYPPRIYVFMHGGLWLDRNRRTMGLAFETPFLKRPMNSEEIEYESHSWRLHAYQFESWERLLKSEEQEIEIMNKEVPGSGTEFLEKLKSFQDRYRLST